MAAGSSRPLTERDFAVVYGSDDEDTKLLGSSSDVVSKFRGYISSQVVDIIVGQGSCSATASVFQHTEFICVLCDDSYSSFRKLKKHAKAGCPSRCHKCDKFKFIVDSASGTYYRCSGNCKRDYKDASRRR